jgi:hypothetical protein
VIGQPHDLSIAEFNALRATIRERGTARFLVVVITFVAWATLVVALEAVQTVALVALAPLTVLFAGFEVVLAMHVGVERIGRFLQVVYEHDLAHGPRWERTAMELGPALGRMAGLDPIFSILFLATALVNLILAGPRTADLPPAISGELALLLGAHLAFAVRVLQGRLFARRQRERELAVMRRIGPARPE